MSSVPRVSNAKLFRIIQCWVAETYPGDEATRIVIRLRSGEELNMKIPGRQELRKEKEAIKKKEEIEDQSVRKYFEFRRKILAALAKSPSPIERKKLMSQAGYNSPSYFRGGLLKMLQEGIITETADGITASAT